MNIDIDSRRELLIAEKRKYGLDEVITKKEEKLLAKNFPIQKIIGYIEFEDVRINVDRNVLIPRYETQEVVHKALEYIKPGMRILDLCCGSGYIGLTIKKKMPDVEVVMSDISKHAVKQTKSNARLNKLDVDVIQSDLLRGLVRLFDVIVCNPPYIPSKYKDTLDSSVLEHEPNKALFAGKDGNDFYKRILTDKEAFRHLKPGGYIVFELSLDNVEFLESKGFKIFNDINGKPRIGVKQFD